MVIIYFDIHGAQIIIYITIYESTKMKELDNTIF